MKRIRQIVQATAFPGLLGLGLLLLLLRPAPARALAAGWYTECKVCAEKLGGNGLSGPWPSKEACEEGRTTGHNAHYPYGPCFSSGLGGASSASSSTDSSLQQSTADALSFGLTHGNGEALGLGMMGLGVMALTSGGNSGQPSAAQAQAQQEEAERQAAYQAEQAAKRRRFLAERDDAANEIALKDSVSDGSGSGLKGGEDEDEDGFKSVPMKGRKKWKVPKLKPVANPLYKKEEIGDAEAATYHKDWDRAVIYARANGGSLGRENGRIAWCMAGHPYLCSGRCYTEEAFNDHRVPCSSTIRTDKP